MVRAWIYNEEDKGDQRLPHFTSPVKWVSVQQLQALGVSYWYIPTTPEAAIANPESGKLGEIRAARQYRNHDCIQVAPGKLPAYEDKIRFFFNEHLHEDEEIRYVLQGTGYFDVRRDRDQAWIRIEVGSGDMIVLPAGLYHRYTNDQHDYIHVMRLFKDNPKWEAINRGPKADDTAARKAYQSQAEPAAGAAAAGEEEPTSTVSVSPVSVSRLTSLNGESFLLQHRAGALANYPHMRAYGGLLYLSGISSRRLDNTHEGVTVQADGSVSLDITAQTRAVLDNIADILSAAGADLGHVVELTCYLVDMQHYAAYNAVYNDYFPSAANGPVRTTVAVKQLPHPNLLIEIKAVAVDPRQQH